AGDPLHVNSNTTATPGIVFVDNTAVFEGVNKRSALGGTSTSDAMLFIRQAGVNLGDKNIKLQSATSQTGDVMHWIDASNNVKLRWMVGGGVMFGTGPFDGNYPAAATYLGINGGVHQYRNVS